MRPRVGKALRDGRQVILHERRSWPLGQRAGDVRRVDNAQHGIKQHDSCAKALLSGNSFWLKKPERIAALGRVLWQALRCDGRWRAPCACMWSLRSSPMTGERKATQKPTACIVMTQVCRGDSAHRREPMTMRPSSGDRPIAVPRGLAYPYQLLQSTP